MLIHIIHLERRPVNKKTGLGRASDPNSVIRQKKLGNSPVPVSPNLSATRLTNRSAKPTYGNLRDRIGLLIWAPKVRT
jgi:hypothetical protein